MGGVDYACYENVFLLK